MYLTVTPTGMDKILAAGTNITTLVGDVFDMITGNDMLAAFAFCGLIGAAVGVFIAIKGAAH